MLARSLGKVLTYFGTATAHPAALLIVIAYGAAWLLIEPDTFDMHGVATLVVWAMTLFIQRAEHRDTQALHAKIDELLRDDRKPRSEIASIDDREPEEIEQHRKAVS